MIITLPNILPPPLLDRLVNAFDDGEFVDGAQSVGSTNMQRKRNEEIRSNSDLRAELAEAVRGAFMANNDFKLIVQPRHVGNVILSRYRDGMHYGDHVDNNIMGAGTDKPMR